MSDPRQDADNPEVQEGEAPEMPEGTRSGFDIEEGSANLENFDQPETPTDDELAVPDPPEEGEGEGEGEGAPEPEDELDNALPEPENPEG